MLVTRNNILDDHQIRPLHSQKAGDQIVLVVSTFMQITSQKDHHEIALCIVLLVRDSKDSIRSLNNIRRGLWASGKVHRHARAQDG